MKLGSSSSTLVTLVALASVAGCLPYSNKHPTLQGGIFAEPRPRAPLAVDEHVVLAPTEDAAILGRVLSAPYDPTRPLTEQLAPNPCAQALVDVEPRPIEDDAVEDASPASSGGPRVYYRLRLHRRLEKAATKGYAECCKKAACGVGYVRALAFGEGEVALARPTPPGGNADVAFEDEGRPTELALTERRAVRGYVTVAIGGQGPLLSRRREEPEGPGDGAYEAARIEVREVRHQRDEFELCTRAECITENEFVRRYARLTGSHELDEFLRNRSWEENVGAIMLGVVGLAAGGLGVGQLTTINSQKTQQDKDGVRLGGGLALGMGLGVLSAALGHAINALGSQDSSTRHHFLTKSQARRFVERYNRALRISSSEKQ
jgi:hypothetical protein